MIKYYGLCVFSGFILSMTLIGMIVFYLLTMNNVTVFERAIYALENYIRLFPTLLFLMLILFRYGHNDGTNTEKNNNLK